MSSRNVSALLGLHVHLTTPTLMTFLRHPSVTITEYHMLNFSGSPMSLYRYDSQSQSYVPISSTIILKWFNQVANGGATYQRLIEQSDDLCSFPVAFKRQDSFS